MRHSKSVYSESDKLVQAMRRYKIPAFEPDVFGLTARGLVCDMISLARKHCRIQERFCSEEMNESTQKRLETMESGLEKRIRECADQLGLRARFDGDPRGFTVKLFSPDGNVWNTWGGAESGYGIGETHA